MVDLYKNIRERRKSLKMSQEELAAKVGYTNRSTIATIETGRMDIPLSKVHELAKALECTTAELMGLQIDKDEAEIFEAGRQDAELLKKYHSLTKEHQRMVLEQISIFLEMENKG